jgi:hypothetical protein
MYKALLCFSKLMYNKKKRKRNTAYLAYKDHDNDEGIINESFTCAVRSGRTRSRRHDRSSGCPGGIVPRDVDVAEALPLIFLVPTGKLVLGHVIVVPPPRGRRGRKYWEGLIGRRSAWIQVATRWRAEGYAGGLEVGFQTHRHHRRVRRRHLVQRSSARRKRRRLVLVLVDRGLVALGRSMRR